MDSEENLSNFINSSPSISSSALDSATTAIVCAFVLLTGSSSKRMTQHNPSQRFMKRWRNSVAAQQKLCVSGFGTIYPLSPMIFVKMIEFSLNLLWFARLSLFLSTKN